MFQKKRNTFTIIRFKMPNKIEVHIRINPKKTNKVWKFTENKLSRIVKDKEIIYKNFNSLLYLENNQKVYIRCLKENICKFENLTVFSYGQTGSGKTYTMLGHEDGMIYLCLKDLLKHFELDVSYIEIYNENAFDLYSNKKLQIFNVDKLIINNLSKIKITNLKEGVEFIEVCEKNRRYGTTEYNVRSSRSHTIFQIEYMFEKNVIENRKNEKNLRTFDDNSTKSNNNSIEAECKDKKIIINLIDLAGSEKMCTKDIRRTEGSFINKSLLALCTVVNNLHNKKYFGFRDSKLTRLLQSSLDGNTNIVALCTMSPSSDCIEESISTLSFAARLSNLDLKKIEIPVQKPTEINICQNQTKKTDYFEQMKNAGKNFIEVQNKINSCNLSINKNKITNFCNMKQNNFNFFSKHQMQQKSMSKEIEFKNDEILTKADKKEIELKNKDKDLRNFNVNNKKINFNNLQNEELIAKSDKLFYELNFNCKNKSEISEIEKNNIKNYSYYKIENNNINNNFFDGTEIKDSNIHNYYDLENIDINSPNLNKKENNYCLEKKPFCDNFCQKIVNINHFYQNKYFSHVIFNKKFIEVDNMSKLKIKKTLLEERVENLEKMIQNLLNKNPNKRTNDIFILEKHMFILKCKKIER